MPALLDVLRTIILDTQENRLETGIPRHMRIDAVKGKATICIGVRRSGKSTYNVQRRLKTVMELAGTTTQVE